MNLQCVSMWAKTQGICVWFLIYFWCGCMFVLCVCLHTMCMWYRRKAEEGIGSSRTGDTQMVGSYPVGDENQTRVLWKNSQSLDH